MHDQVLNTNDHAEALRRGWLVTRVWDLATQKLITLVLPAAGAPIKNHTDLQAVVMSRAMAGDAFAATVMKALKA